MRLMKTVGPPMAWPEHDSFVAASIENFASLSRNNTCSGFRVLTPACPGQPSFIQDPGHGSQAFTLSWIEGRAQPDPMTL